MNRQIKQVCLVVILILLSLDGQLFAQKSVSLVDSMICASAKQSSVEKVQTLERIARSFMQKNPDTAIYYSNIAVEESKKLKIDSLLGKSHQIMGNSLYYKGLCNEAIDSYSKSLMIWENINDTDRIIKLNINITRAYSRIDEDEKAIKILYELLNRFQETGDSSNNFSDIYGTIGRYHAKLKNYKLSEEFYLKAIRVESSTKKDKALLDKYNNELGITYTELKEYDKAIACYQKSIELSNERSKSNPNKNVIAHAYSNIAMLYYKQKKYDKAIDIYNEVEKIYRDRGFIERYLGIHTNIATIIMDKGDYERAYKELKYILSNIDTIKNNNLKYEIYGAVAKAAECSGFINEAYRYKKLEMAMSDSIFRIEKERALFEIQERYSSRIKSNEIAMLKKDNSIQKLQNEKQRNVQRGLIACIALLLVMIIGITYGVRIIKSKNNLLKESNDKLLISEKSLRDRNAEILAQNEEIMLQKEFIAKQSERIQSSINYAAEIQTAMLPPIELIKSVFPNSFVLYKPLDIVSGDFYWVKQIGTKSVCVVADSTGHGVPGAFMSMLGLSILSEVVGKLDSDSLHPDIILSIMRERVVSSLHQSLDYGTIKDGIDAAMIIIDNQTKTLEFAGADIPIIIIKNGEAQVIKGDNIPVGISSHQELHFTRHSLSIEVGATIYAFSDGYVDQIGGTNARKYLKKNLVEFLKNIHNKPMYEQQQLLDNNIISWQGRFKQIDDILVMGIKL